MTSVQVVSWNKEAPPSEPEAEARLHQEGYDEVFRWNDVAGVVYPEHRHAHDECIWILKGEMVFQIHQETYLLKAGDRLYLPAGTHHTAEAPKNHTVIYLVGRKT